MGESTFNAVRHWVQNHFVFLSPKTYTVKYTHMYNFTRYFVWVWYMVSHPKAETKFGNVQGQAATSPQDGKVAWRCSELQLARPTLRIIQSRDSSVSTVTRLRARRSAVGIPAAARDASLFQLVHTGCGGPPSLLFNAYRNSLPRLKWQGRDFIIHVHVASRLWVGQYLFSPYMPSWCEQGQPYSLPFTLRVTVGWFNQTGWDGQGMQHAWNWLMHNKFGWKIWTDRLGHTETDITIILKWS
jgi:hypothetical protein